MPEAFNQRQLTLKRNPDYWQADKIKVEKLVFTKAEGGNQVENLKLAQGEYDMNAMFVPNIEQAYVARDPEHNQYWFPAGGAIGLGMNLQKAPFNDVEFRRAMAYAINREEIINKAQFGYVTQASQTGLVLPGQKDWMPERDRERRHVPVRPGQGGQDPRSRRLYQGRRRQVPEQGRPADGVHLPGAERLDRLDPGGADHPAEPGTRWALR